MTETAHKHPYYQVSLRRSDNAAALVERLVGLVQEEKGVQVTAPDAVLIAIKEAIAKRTGAA
jgi:hypothetical protein